MLRDILESRGTLLKLGIEDRAANIFNCFQVEGEIGHLIRQGTYLELFTTPIHNLSITTDWLKDNIFKQHLHSGGEVDKAVKTAEIMGGVVIGAIVPKKMLNQVRKN